MYAHDAFSRSTFAVHASNESTGISGPAAYDRASSSYWACAADLETRALFFAHGVDLLDMRWVMACHSLMWSSTCFWMRARSGVMGEESLSHSWTFFQGRRRSWSFPKNRGFRLS